MGKKAQIKRQKQAEAENLRRSEIKTKRLNRQPWLKFWLLPVFWIYVICVMAVIFYPFVSPLLPKGTVTKAGNEAIIHTSLGNIEITLYPHDAPKTVENFTTLAERGYYNNLTWHRIIKDFVIQGGDPKGDGTGGESAWGGTFEDEINPRSLGVAEEQITSLEGQGYKYKYTLQSHKLEPGSIAMANSGPNTNGSQFFIVTEKAQPQLDGKHTVFGTVKSGMDVVKAIAAVKTDQSDKPEAPVTITSVEVK